MIVPRDRSGEFEPQVVKKHQMDITNIEDKIIGLYGCGMSTRDISDNIKEIYGFEVSAETINLLRKSERKKEAKRETIEGRYRRVKRISNYKFQR